MVYLFARDFYFMDIFGFLCHCGIKAMIIDKNVFEMSEDLGDFLSLFQDNHII